MCTTAPPRMSAPFAPFLSNAHRSRVTVPDRHARRVAQTNQTVRRTPARHAIDQLHLRALDPEPTPGGRRHFARLERRRRSLRRRSAIIRHRSIRKRHREVSNRHPSRSNLDRALVRGRREMSQRRLRSAAHRLDRHAVDADDDALVQLDASLERDSVPGFAARSASAIVVPPRSTRISEDSRASARRRRRRRRHERDQLRAPSETWSVRLPRARARRSAPVPRAPRGRARRIASFASVAPRARPPARPARPSARVDESLARKPSSLDVTSSAPSDAPRSPRRRRAR